MATSWSDLTPELQEGVAEFLPGNEVACSLRLLNKAAAELFRGVAQVRLSEPVPPRAFVWRWGSPAAFRSLTLKSRRQLLALTAGSGVLSNLQVAVAAAGCWPLWSAFASAASAGHLSICEWLAGQGYQCWTTDAVEAAASKGHIALLRWILSRCPNSNECVWFGAARAGRRDVCEALRADAGPTFVVPLSTVYGAAKGGHPDLVQWLLPYARVKELDDVKLLQDAVYGCGLAGMQHVNDTLSAIQQDGWRPLRQGGLLLLAALTSPTPDWRAKVDWLRDLGCAVNNQTASESGFTLPDALQPGDRIERARLYLQLLPEAERAVAIQNILSNALRLAAPELVDFALEQCPQGQLADLAVVVSSRGSKACIMEPGVRNGFWCPYAFETSAQVAVAARLAAPGVPIWPTVVQAAIQTDSLQMLQWIAAGADAAGQEGAAGAGVSVADLEGLAGAGPEVRAAAAAGLRAALERSGADLASLAAEAGNLEMMQWLRAHGCAWNAQTFTRAAQAGNVALLEWMAEEGCPLPTEYACYEYALIISKDMAVLQCLRRLGLPWGPPEQELFGTAVSCGCRVELLAWLLEEGCAVDWEEARRASAALEGNTPQADAVRAFIQQSAP